MALEEEIKAGVEIFSKFTAAVPEGTKILTVLVVAIHFSRACAEQFAKQGLEGVSCAKAVLGEVDKLRGTVVDLIDRLENAKKN